MCKDNNSNIDWTKPLKFHNNDQFVVEVIGDSLTSQVAVQMYHPKVPLTKHYSIFDRGTGYCLEKGRNNEFNRITNREVCEWCVSYSHRCVNYVAKFVFEDIADRARTRMLNDASYSDISPLWKQIKK